MPRYFAKQEVVSNGQVISVSTTHIVESIERLKKVVINNRRFLRKKMNTECEDFTDRVRVYRVGRDSRNHLLAVPHGIYLVEEFEDKGIPYAIVTRTKNTFVDMEGDV